MSVSIEVGIPQVILLGLGLLVLGIDIAEHGKQKIKRVNAWQTLIGIVLLHSLLYWGGFYS